MLQSKNFGANKLLRIVAALGLALALAACSSSSGPSQGALDKANADAKMYMEQLDAVHTALDTAGATGETVEEKIASLTAGGMDPSTLEAMLRAAGVEGADLEALIAAAVVNLNAYAELKEKERMAMETANRANYAKVHELLATLTANQLVDGDAVTVPKDAHEGEHPDRSHHDSLACALRYPNGRRGDDSQSSQTLPPLGNKGRGPKR